jgi:hypothetical protein
VESFGQRINFVVSPGQDGSNYRDYTKLVAFITHAGDADGDGFDENVDCDDTDPAINPDAVELPWNYIDENCNGDFGACYPCNSWRNHGEYVRCVAKEVNELCSSGALAEDECDGLVSSAAQSDVGKKDYIPTECQ